MSENKDGATKLDAALQMDLNDIYFNGFTCGIGPGDIVCVLERNGRPVVTLNCSYTVAKTLSVALGNLIAQFESATGRTMLTTKEVDQALNGEASSL